MGTEGRRDGGMAQALGGDLGVGDRRAAAASPSPFPVLGVAAANAATLRLRGTLQVPVADAWYGEATGDGPLEVRPGKS